MADPNIFCTTPWYELQIYWDGGLGICCTERHRLYPESQQSQYNIANMSIKEWFNSPPVQQFRQALLGNRQHSACGRCYAEEALGAHSRRLKSNIKAAIFPIAFEQSFEQSPARHRFSESGLVDSQPIDMHIDLGNHCNLTCKMCDAASSSKIAAQELKWGNTSSQKFVGQDWTANEQVWQRFMQQLLDIPNLSNIHFMGGETLLSKRIEQLVDFLARHQRFDVAFSFVTNGTLYRPDLIRKMSKFRRVGIEISIETVTEHNSYVRQGTDTAQVLDHIQKYKSLCSAHMDVTLRPAISALTIGQFHTLLQYAMDHQLVIKPNWCIRPTWLNPNVLPGTIKQQYLLPYQQLMQQLCDVDISQPFNASDRHNVKHMVKQWALACIQVLESDQPADAEILLSTMVSHCKRWDTVSGLSPATLYPELMSLFESHA